jgi:formylmethanofuran dehydrogenase subunit B
MRKVNSLANSQLLTFPNFQCAIFQKQTSLASKVFMPNTAPYKEQEATYYNSENINLKPACRVSPTTAADVSLIIKLATKSACKFAVRSKGHMNWASRLFFQPYVG